MLALEEKINEASRTMSALINSLEMDMQLIPAGVTFTEPAVSAPLDIKVFSNTPLGYRCVYLLIGFDQFSKKHFRLHTMRLYHAPSVTNS